MKRTSAFLLAGLAGLPLSTGCGKRPRPVILISLDTLRQDHLGCYGYSRGTSPNLDRFAGQEAALFEWAFCQATYTLPSHMSMLTSLYPETHGVLLPFTAGDPGGQDGLETLDETANTVVIKERNGQKIAALPRSQLDTSRLADSVTTLAEVFQRNGFRTAAFTDGLLVDSKYGFDQGFDSYRDERNRRPEPNGFRRYGQELHQWIRDHAAEDFFLFVHSYDTHGPFSCPEPYRSRFRAAPPAVELPPVSLTHCSYLDVNKYFDLPQYSDVQQLVDHYDGCVAFVDAQVGRLFDLLRELEIFDDALIVVTSDHGEAFMENGVMIGHALCPTNEVTLVPLLIKLPGGEHAGRRIDNVVESVDIMPSMLAALGLEPPRSCQGQDLIAGLETGRFAKNYAFGILPNTGRNHYLVQDGTKYIEAVNDPDHWLMKLNMIPLAPPGARRPNTPYYFISKDRQYHYDFEEDALGLLELFDRGDRLYDMATEKHERKAPPITEPERLKRAKSRTLALSRALRTAGERYVGRAVQSAESSSAQPAGPDLPDLQDLPDMQELSDLGYLALTDPSLAAATGSRSEVRTTPTLIDRSLLIQGDALLWRLSLALEREEVDFDVSDLDRQTSEARAVFGRFLELHPDRDNWVQWRLTTLELLSDQVRNRR